MSNVIETVDIHINELNFKNRPIQINYKYRVIFQVSKVILILGMTSSKLGSSILKLQIISDALDNEELLDYLKWLIDNNSQEFARSWRYSSLLSRAVSYSNAEGLTEYSKTGKLVLTKQGQALYDEICKSKELFKNEKEQLLKIKKKFSDAKLLQILEKGSI